MHCAVKLVVLPFCSFLSWVIPEKQDELPRMRLGGASSLTQSCLDQGNLPYDGDQVLYVMLLWHWQNPEI